MTVRDTLWEILQAYMVSWAAANTPIKDVHRRLVAEGLHGEFLTLAMNRYRDELRTRRRAPS